MLPGLQWGSPPLPQCGEACWTDPRNPLQMDPVTRNSMLFSGNVELLCAMDMDELQDLHCVDAFGDLCPVPSVKFTVKYENEILRASDRDLYQCVRIEARTWDNNKVGCLLLAECWHSLLFNSHKREGCSTFGFATGQKINFVCNTVV